MHARHTGSVGDVYNVDAAKAEYSKTRVGHGDFASLQEGDVLVRTAHSGDCFSTYAVFRNGKRLAKEWCGYDMFEKAAWNVVQNLTELPVR